MFTKKIEKSGMLPNNGAYIKCPFFIVFFLF